MNFKNIFMIMVVLFIALGISAVSAQDITNDDNAISDSNGYSAIESSIIESDLPDGVTGVADDLNDTEIVANDVVYPDGQKKEYSVTLLSNGTPLAGQDITFFVNDELKSTSTTDENGTAVLDVEFLDVGTYTIDCKFAGTVDYNASQATAVVKVCNSILASDLTKYCRNATQFNAVFYDGNGSVISKGIASYIINGKTYKRNITDGQSTMEINLRVGNYKVIVKNPVTNETATYNITVLSTIIGKNLTKYYCNGSQFYVTILDAQGNIAIKKDITININGVFYKRNTNSSGIAELKIYLFPKQYILTVTDLESGDEQSFFVDVLSTINATDYKTTYETGGKFVFKVLDGQGKPLANQAASLNINGKIYKRTTDVNGSAYLNIQLMPNKYICTVTSNGLSRSYNITVDKRTPSMRFISTTVKTRGKLECEFTYNKEPIKNHVVYFLFNGTVPYAVFTDNAGIGAVTLDIPAGNYMFYVGIDDAYYANVFTASTITVTN